MFNLSIGIKYALPKICTSSPAPTPFILLCDACVPDPSTIFTLINGLCCMQLIQVKWLRTYPDALLIRVVVRAATVMIFLTVIDFYGFTWLSALFPNSLKFHVLVFISGPLSARFPVSGVLFYTFLLACSVCLSRSLRRMFASIDQFFYVFSTCPYFMFPTWEVL